MSHKHELPSARAIGERIRRARRRAGMTAKALGACLGVPGNTVTMYESQGRGMSLEQWADLSQIVGGLAVVASLIFVGLQLRQNTDAIRASTSQAHSAMYHAINTSVIDSSDFARIWRAGLSDFESL